MTRPTVAVFRPADERLERAVWVLEDLGAEPLADPLLAVEPTGRSPRGGADVVVFTSVTGVELAGDDWSPGDATVCAIGPTTADALRRAGHWVDLVPAEYTSAGLVEALRETGDLAGADVEVARSDHGSPVLLEGLEAAGARVTETVLYRLERPPGSGRSAVRAAAGDLEAVLFTSSLTVEHFVEAAAEREVGAAARRGLERAVVGAIGEPTAETARDHGLAVDVVASEASFERLATETLTAVRDLHV